MIDFEGVVSTLGQALDERGYTTLTPVQTAMLAPELRGADALVSAQTGSGKTIAFGMALAPTLLGAEGRFEGATSPVALIVAPTRELAMQVRRELEWLYARTGAVFASCVGGMDIRAERRVLDRGAHIVVGTPGRLCDHIGRGALDLAGIKAVVLDEADEMLDLGFREDLEYILDAAPAERRTLMFSATVPRPIVALAKRYQRDAVRVATVSEAEPHGDIEYRAYQVAPSDRDNAVINVLRYYEAQSALVFCATRATVNHLTSRFANRGLSVVALSGELSQSERNHALQAMRDGRARVCIATDVAARGLDLPHLELVIHADPPKNRESLLHRSGRTGRAGQKGISVLVVPHTWRRRTERLLQSANIEAYWSKPPSADDVLRRDDERLLADPALSEPLRDEERAFAHDLVERHGAEQIAAAFVRLYRAGRSAPEELLDAAPAERPTEHKEKLRDDFSDGVWFELSVGRDQKAEPRWLLPMLCRAGHVTKNEVGAIRVRDKETYVQLVAGCAERFLAAIGPSATVEKTITVTRLDGEPPAPFDIGAGAPARRPYVPGDRGQERKPWKKRQDGPAPYAKRRRPEGEAPVSGAVTQLEPDRAPARVRAAEDGPKERKPWKKKGVASVFSEGGGKGRRLDNSSAKPLKRKKPKRGD